MVSAPPLSVKTEKANFASENGKFSKEPSSNEANHLRARVQRSLWWRGRNITWGLLTKG